MEGAVNGLVHPRTLEIFLFYNPSVAASCSSEGNRSRSFRGDVEHRVIGSCWFRFPADISGVGDGSETVSRAVKLSCCLEQRLNSRIIHPHIARNQIAPGDAECQQQENGAYLGLALHRTDDIILVNRTT